MKRTLGYIGMAMAGALVALVAHDRFLEPGAVPVSTSTSPASGPL